MGKPGTRKDKEKELQENQGAINSGLSDSNTPNWAAALISGQAKLESKLDSIESKFDTLYKTINNPDDGLKVRVDSNEFTVKTNSSDIESLKSDNESLKSQVELLSSMVIKLKHDLQSACDRITDLTTRSMSDNLIISNLPERHDENCTQAFSDFIGNKLGVECSDNIIRAHRIGTPSDDGTKFPRPLVAKLNPSTKSEILENRKALKGQKAPNGKFFSVQDQVPDSISEQRKRAYAIAKRQWDANKNLPDKDKVNVRIVKGTSVMFNNTLLKPPVHVPSAREMLCTDPQETEKMKKLRFQQSKPQGEKDSTFVAYGCKVSSLPEVQRAYLRIRKEHAAADKVVCAFSAPGNHGNQVTDYCDDNEWGGGFCALKALLATNHKNTAVFVVRYYGGQHLGPKRFRHITEVTTAAINKLHG